MCFELGEAIEVHDRIIVGFYTGLPHIYIGECEWDTWSLSVGEAFKNNQVQVCYNTDCNKHSIPQSADTVLLSPSSMWAGHWYLLYLPSDFWPLQLDTKSLKDVVTCVLRYCQNVVGTNEIMKLRSTSLIAVKFAYQLKYPNVFLSGCVTKCLWTLLGYTSLKSSRNLTFAIKRLGSGHKTS